MRQNLYQTLGIKPTAGKAEIKSAYRKLARKYHPDVNPGDRSAEEQFKQVGEAYNILGDKKKRAQYDQYNRMKADGFSGAGPGFDFSRFEAGDAAIEDILAQIFGSGAFGKSRSGTHAWSARQQAAPGQDYETPIELTFEEAVLGTQKALNIAVPGACRRCNGRGVIAGGGACAACGGRGLKETAETIRVRIPPGVKQGRRIRVPGKGGAGRGGGPPGALYLLPRVAPHRIFRREGRDIVMDLPLSFPEAALGARVEVPTLTGSVTMTIPPGTQGGRKFRLAGKGVPASSRKGTGDQIAIVRITVPENLDARSRKIIEELAKRVPAEPEDAD